MLVEVYLRCRGLGIMQFKRRLLIFGAAFFLFILFGQALPVTDPVESNYVLTAQEMVLSNDWLSPTIYHHFWFDKPVFFYWLLGISFKVFGTSEIAARFVPALLGACAVSLIEWYVTETKTARQGIIAAGILATFLQYFLLSKLIITDMVLFLFDSAAMVFFCFGLLRVKGSKRWYLLMYPCLALAVLTKGPVGIFLPMLIIILSLTLLHKWAELKNMYLISGTLLFLLVAVPWYLLMYLKHGKEFLLSFFGVHNYLRATVSEHPKDNVFFYYFVIFALSTLPWTGLALGGVYEGYKGLRRRDFQASLLALWAMVYFGFYSLMATKYVTYTFPMLFAVAALTATFIDNRLYVIKKRNYFMVVIPLLILGLASVGVSHRYLDRTAFISFALMVGVLLAGACYFAYNRNLRRIVTSGIVATTVFYLLLTAILLPLMAQDRSGKNLAAIVKMYPGYQVGTYDFYSTSAVFYSGQVLIKVTQADVGEVSSEEGLSWSIKYTMPSSSAKAFGESSGANILIVPDNRKQEFEKENIKWGYSEKARVNQYYIYEKVR